MFCDGEYAHAVPMEQREFFVSLHCHAVDSCAADCRHSDFGPPSRLTWLVICMSCGGADLLHLTSYSWAHVLVQLRQVFCVRLFRIGGCGGTPEPEPIEGPDSAEELIVEEEVAEFELNESGEDDL